MRRIVNGLNKLKNLFSPGIYRDGSVIVDYYIRFILLFYPLLALQNQVHIFTGKTILYYTLTLFTVAVYIFIILKKKAVCRKQFRTMDLSLMFITGVLMVKIIIQLIHKDLSSDKEIFLCSMVVTYFLLRSVNKGYMSYFKLVLLSSSILYVGLLGYLNTGIESMLREGSLFQQPEGLASWMILSCVTAALLFCMEKSNIYKQFYLLSACTGFLVLSLYGDIKAVIVTGAFLLLIPLFFVPTVTLVKNNLILCFSLLFIYSTAPLLLHYKWFRSDRQYNLQYSIYILLFLAAAGALICRYCEKIPKNIPPDNIAMKKFRAWYKQILIAVGIVLSFYILIGTRMAELPERFGMKALKAFSTLVLQSVNTSKSVFQALLEDYGVIGCAMWICLMLMIIKHLIRRWKSERSDVKALVLLSVLFLVQAFFYQLQPVSTPAYVILLTLALYADKPKTPGEVKETQGIEKIQEGKGTKVKCDPEE